MKNRYAHWWQKAEKDFVGKKIVGVRYMSSEECNDMGWDSAPICLLLDDGTYIFPSRDDEGNDGGALFTNAQDKDCPVLSVGWENEFEKKEGVK
jgi:hypothetical protein|tara:strand:+ start:516 stop:797 length:282 start_codon:yes stop_codon:yes gene_type:complete